MMQVGLDAVTLYLNGRVESDLDWRKSHQEAQQAVEKGFRLMWEMDLGLFHALKQPLIHQGQFLSFALALEHFRDFIWPEFGSNTIGLSLFRGNADFSYAFPWDLQQEENLAEWLREHQFSELASLSLACLQQHPVGKRLLPLFCRDVAMEYLSLLAARLPDAIPLYLSLDVTSYANDPLGQVQLLHPERFDRFHLILKGATLPLQLMGDEPSMGIYLPSLNCCQDFHYQGFEEVIAILREKRLPFKLIAENQLTLQWAGLDFLFYFSSGLSVQGKRKMQGFCAAGGTPIAVQESIGLSGERNLKEWIATYD